MALAALDWVLGPSPTSSTPPSVLQSLGRPTGVYCTLLHPPVVVAVHSWWCPVYQVSMEAMEAADGCRGKYTDGLGQVSQGGVLGMDTQMLSILITWSPGRHNVEARVKNHNTQQRRRVATRTPFAGRKPLAICAPPPGEVAQQPSLSLPPSGL